MARIVESEITEWLGIHRIYKLYKEIGRLKSETIY